MLTPTFPVSLAAAPPAPTPYTDYTISTDTWWTTAATGSGANDSTSFANRMPIPTDIDNLIVKDDATLTVVLETQDGAITLGHNTNSGKYFYVYGTLLTVDENNEFNPDCAYNLYIGGTVSVGEGVKRFYSGATIQIFNTHFGQDINGTATASTVTYTNYLEPWEGYYVNCDFKEKVNYRGVRLLAGYFKNCTFYGPNNGTGITMYAPQNAYFEDCTWTTTGTYIFNYPQGILNFIGSMTMSTTEYYHSAGYRTIFQYWSRAYHRITDGTNNISGAVDAAYRTPAPSDRVEAHQTVGVSNSSGIVETDWPSEGTSAILVPYKREFYDWPASGVHYIGTPDYSETYANYTFTIAKPGYETATYNRLMTSDWGTEASPINITLNASVAGEPLVNTSVGTSNYAGEYDEAIGTNDTIWLDGEIAIYPYTDDVWVNVSVYDSTDTWLGTLINTKYNWNATTNPVPLSTLYTGYDFGNGLPYFNSTGHPAGDYYFYVMVNKSGEITLRHYASQFAVQKSSVQAEITGHSYDPPTASNRAVRYEYGDTVYISGNITMPENTSNTLVNIYLQGAGAPVTVMSRTYNFTRAAEVSLQAINAGNTPNITLNYSEGKYYLELALINTDNITTQFYNFTFHLEIKNATAPGGTSAAGGGGAGGGTPNPIFEANMTQVVGALDDIKYTVVYSVVGMAVLILILSSARRTKHQAGRRWNVGAVEMRWKPKRRKAGG